VAARSFLPCGTCGGHAVRPRGQVRSQRSLMRGPVMSAATCARAVRGKAGVGDPAADGAYHALRLDPAPTSTSAGASWKTVIAVTRAISSSFPSRRGPVLHDAPVASPV
jgi:hypothetical protein